MRKRESPQNSVTGGSDSTSEAAFSISQPKKRSLALQQVPTETGTTQALPVPPISPPPTGSRLPSQANGALPMPVIYFNSSRSVFSVALCDLPRRVFAGRSPMKSHSAFRYDPCNLTTVVPRSGTTIVTLRRSYPVQVRPM